MKLSPFSVILVFVVLAVAGAGIAPLLNLQYTPTQKQKSLSVSFDWPGASARVIEAEVTTKLEGVIASVAGVSNINSVSEKESGRITVELKPTSNPEAIRYEIASLIRRVYPKLPDGITYPYISASSAGENQAPVLIYTINAKLPTNKIGEYVQENIVKEISLIKGTAGVSLSGITPTIVQILFKPELLKLYSLSQADISSAIGNELGKKDIIGNFNGTTLLLSIDSNGKELEQIALKNVEGRIIRLGDIARIEFKESTPSYYYRINGLNTVNVRIFPEKGVNSIVLCNAIKAKMGLLSEKFPQNFSAIIIYDTSDYLKKELNTILIRTVLSIIILLLFVLIASRSLRYLAIIAITLLANILIAFIFYYFFKLEIHLYSLAGITVSLGIVIDTSIIMISHYGYFRNRNVFIAILAALLTTIGALSIIFFLPDEIRTNLLDFAAVIIINLIVSLAIAMLLIPALIETYPIKGVNSKKSIKSIKFIIGLNRIYEKFILFGSRHKLIFIIVLFIGFGIPVQLLPEKMEPEVSVFDKLYNKTIGSEVYRNSLKKPIEVVFGGTLRLFLNNLSGGGLYRDPQRTTLFVRASMPAGCTIGQLNEIVVYMENYLSQFPEIDMFNTQITSYKNASISVTFKKEYEYSGFPLFLKNNVISKAIDFGGANWSVYGIDENGFSNNVGAYGFKSNRIVITGYNYDMLYQYCLESVQSLQSNIRVSEPGIFGEVGWNSELSKVEYFIDYDLDKMATLNISPSNAYNSLNRELNVYSIGNYSKNNEVYGVSLLSANKEKFDVWNLKNEYLSIGDKTLKFSEIGKIEKRRTGNNIYKVNQQYSLVIAYDFIGPYELAKRVNTRETDRLNSILPLGFKAERGDLTYDISKSEYFWIIFIIVAIIFFVSAILFESLSQPLIIVSLIPISFIGVFITFYFTKFTFDQGGLAALIMLSGISVNAGIYILNQYNLLRRGKQENRPSVKVYIKAYNLKIVPISLTILSTVLGLVPFLMNGKNDVFWFAFAVGTMGGLVFSILGIIFFLPIWKK